MSDTDIAGKVVVITGANSGIGKVTAKDLAARDARIVMICRNRERAEEARNEIVSETKNPNVFVLLADLGNQQQVRAVAREFCDMFEKLDILINNAGMIDSRRHETKEGIEKTLAVNHLGAFLLTNLLLDPMKNAEKARIITVASEAHKYADFDIDNVQLERGYTTLKAYANSKLCNILFTIELAQRLEEKACHITANCLHPGAVATNFGFSGSLWFKLVWLVSWPFLISEEKGAETLIYLATSSNGADKNGEYFKQCKQATPSTTAQNKKLAAALWEKSVELTGLTTEVV